MERREHPIRQVQGMITGTVARQFPNLPEWLDSRDTPMGNARIWIDKRTGKEIEIGLCDMRGFLLGVMFAG